MRIYLDDERFPKGAGWHIVRTAEEALKLLDTVYVSEISLDHDLGTELTGATVATYIEYLCWKGAIKCPKWNVHSANPVGRENIEAAMKSAESFTVAVSGQRRG